MDRSDSDAKNLESILRSEEVSQGNPHVYKPGLRDPRNVFTGIATGGVANLMAASVLECQISSWYQLGQQP